MAPGTPAPPGPPAPSELPGPPVAGRSLAVVVPAHNEADYLDASIAAIVAGTRPLDLPVEILVVENGSTDATRAVAAEVAGRHPEVQVIELPDADYGRALRAGLLAASADLVVTFDVDLVDLGFLERALALVDADVVIGSKRGPGADDTRPWSRRLVTWTFSSLLRHGFGLRASDTHGMKVLRRSTTAALVAACRSGADIFDTELILRAERAGLRVCEVPVRVTEQRPPRTGIASRIPRTLVGLARLRLSLGREPGAAP